MQLARVESRAVGGRGLGRGRLGRGDARVRRAWRPRGLRGEGACAPGRSRSCGVPGPHLVGFVGVDAGESCSDVGVNPTALRARRHSI